MPGLAMWLSRPIPVRSSCTSRPVDRSSYSIDAPSRSCTRFQGQGITLRPILEGNLYTAETGQRRAQKYAFQGLSPGDSP